MGRLFEGPHIWIILLVVLIIWGAPKLPGFAKSLGQSMRIFRKEMKQMSDERAEDKKPAAEKDSPKDE
ncbi:MAG: twin-arginine translocase TatA/TatE family subunit [Micrococcales bacterium]|nr:twin-arginine translocase TatA/TatE family subunit [Micrococcales bacterium]NBR60389.1 twin-arginine translocase TatA/TatE family subunit [Actinomycetota bacterium]NBR54438.1 twin-arginine translocase TatA/TatE family subunit [Micrococcales bacterium]NBT46273.1 twin-arginine translocase TatA/TatE family subunit [Actinomycetota bacterium]NBY44340.1 twin-arginine translocase TatA/TatE family subunit [Micrococcales bacterium]